jgi:isopenicillin N synthase-like dioxygenase
MILYTPPQVATQIPIIDFDGAFSNRLDDRRRVAAAIHSACRETGFFYIANHRVPRSLIDAQFESARALFGLPIEQKLAIHMQHSRSNAGYEPIGGQVLDSQDASVEAAPPDLKESFYAGMELPDDHPRCREGLRGYGHNQWPAALPAFEPQQLAYQAAMCSLGNRLLAMIALSLEMPEDFFVSHYEPYATTTLRLIKYPPHPQAALANQIGAGAHTDWGGVTLLAQDDLGGLEVRNRAGDWLQATPIPDTFVVNLGDLMQRWTNDIYRSNMHRVKNNNAAGRDRYSIPFFYSPMPEAMIECVPSCTDAEHPAKYAPITAKAHLDEMFRRSYGYAPGTPKAAR